MPRPPGHGPGYETRRGEIVDRAARLFAQHGYAATGIADLAEEVGLGKGALYYYIGSKENLLVEIQAQVITPLLDSALRIADLTESPLVRLRLISEVLLENIMHRLDHVWVYEHDYKHLSGVNREQFLKQRHEFEDVLLRVLDEAIDDGYFRKIDTRLAMLQFLNMHNHTFQWIHSEPSWTAESLSREYCGTLFGGLCEANHDLDELERKAAQWRSTYVV